MARHELKKPHVYVMLELNPIARRSSNFLLARLKNPARHDG